MISIKLINEIISKINNNDLSYKIISENNLKLVEYNDVNYLFATDLKFIHSFKETYEDSLNKTTFLLCGCIKLHLLYKDYFIDLENNFVSKYIAADIVERYKKYYPNLEENIIDDVEIFSAIYEDDNYKYYKLVANNNLHILFDSNNKVYCKNLLKKSLVEVFKLNDGSEILLNVQETKNILIDKRYNVRFINVDNRFINTVNNNYNIIKCSKYYVLEYIDNLYYFARNFALNSCNTSNNCYIFVLNEKLDIVYRSKLEKEVFNLYNNENNNIEDFSNYDDCEKLLIDVKEYLNMCNTINTVLNN